MPFKMRNTILCSAAMSAVVVSAIFLAELIRIANIFLLVPYFLVVAVIYTALLLSESRKALLLKWVLALPFSFFCFEYFWQTHYSIRALNWMIDGYGKQSAGGNFTGFLLLILLFALCAVGILFAYSRSSEKIKRYTKSAVSGESVASRFGDSRRCYFGSILSLLSGSIILLFQLKYRPILPIKPKTALPQEFSLQQRRFFFQHILRRRAITSVYRPLSFSFRSPPFWLQTPCRPGCLPYGAPPAFPGAFPGSHHSPCPCCRISA